MWFPRTGLGLIHVDIIHFSTIFAFVLMIDLHDVDLLLTVHNQFFLILDHQILSNTQLPDLLGLPHLDNHVVKDEKWIFLDRLQSLKDIAILLAIKIKRILWRVLALKLIDWI